MYANDYATATDQYVELDINQLWNEKIQKLSDRVRAIARGDDDLYQEGILGIRDRLLRNPDATDSYLLQAARYAMTNYRNRGKSIDNGYRRATRSVLSDGTVMICRKQMIPIYIDHLVADFQMEYPDYSYPLLRPTLTASLRMSRRSWASSSSATRSPGWWKRTSSVT